MVLFYLVRKENLKAFSKGSREVGVVTSLLQTTDFLRFYVDGNFILEVKVMVLP